MINGLSKEFSNKTEAEQKKAFADLLLSTVLNADFTNARVYGKSAQVFICATPEITMYFAREHKGHKGIAGTPFEQYHGILIHDHDNPNLNKIQTFSYKTPFCNEFRHKSLDFILNLYFQPTKINKRTVCFFPFWRQCSVFFIFKCRKCFCYLFCGNIHVNHSCLDVFMSRLKRYLYDVYTVFKPMKSFCMAKLMSMEAQGYIGTPHVASGHIFLQKLINCCLAHFPVFPTFLE